jgi:hypothetical protein
MTQNDDPYTVAHVVARLAGEEDCDDPRQRLVAWVTKHYPDRPELPTVVNRGWGTAHDERAARAFIFERYTAACKALDGLYAGTDDIPPGGFHAYLADWCYFNSVRVEPDASFRRPARAGAAGARPAPAAAVRAEDQPALPAGLGA